MNYHKMMMEMLRSQNSKPRILLHSCCGPCSSYVIDLLTEYADITIYYYNPNIEPREEYEKRKSEQIKFINNYKGVNKLDYLDADYDNDLYQKCIKGLEKEKEGGLRCNECFKLRLSKTAIVGKAIGYDYFGTTLTVSPLKNSKVINELGLDIEIKEGIKFLVSDFKKEDGYKKSTLLAKEYNLYRQDYCGCMFSKR